MAGWKEFYEERQDRLEEEPVRLAVFGSLDDFVRSEVSRSSFRPEIKRRLVIALAVCCSLGTQYDTGEDGSLYEYWRWCAETANRLCTREIRERRRYVMSSVSNFFELIKDTVNSCGGDYKEAAEELGIEYYEPAMRKAVRYLEYQKEQEKRRREKQSEEGRS